MIKIKNNIIPFRGFTAITIWPFIFYRTEGDWLNHENIHGRQQAELLLVGFYMIYLVEWILKGYKSISFEKEAYQNEGNSDYLKTRKIFNQWRP